MSNHELSADRLRHVFDVSSFDFETTEDLPVLEAVIGQDRAVRAISFGIEIASPGYHMYALGPVGTGKTTTISKFLDRKAAEQPTPDDWLYVNNFQNADRPCLLRLPAGIGRKLRDDMNRFAEDMQSEIPQAFESEDYEREQEQLQKEFQDRRQHLLQVLQSKAEEKGCKLVQTPGGILIAPVVDGEVVTPDNFNGLSEKARGDAQKRQQEVQEDLRDSMRQVRRLQQEARKRVRNLDRQIVGFCVEHLLEELHEKYRRYEPILAFLQEVRNDALDNVEDYKKAKQMEQARQQMPLLPSQGQDGPDFRQYRVNLIVDNSQAEGAPVVLESNPTYPNLVGRVEYRAQFGALVTDHSMIRGGALHRANGGYLMVHVIDVLTKPMAWQGLKRALKDRCVKIESMQQAFGIMSTRTLDPEPVPLDVKVVLVGSPMLYYLLYNLDEDFQELFKVKADFATHVDWDEGCAGQYAQFVATICREERLRHFTPGGVAKVIERSARLVSHQRKLSTKFGDIVDLVRQASYWAGEAGHELVQGEDVEKAVHEQVYRSNRVEALLKEMVEDGTILLDAAGQIVGQVNGIAVLMLGDYAFGKPTRITARTHVGSTGVVNIERETKLGGRVHNKGVLILTGYLGGKYAMDVPLALTGTLTFEQSYEEIDGDSASSTELYALLSSLAGLPLRQDLAVTGSVNQHGQVQAIGGVNEKIEGFFDVCKIKGFTGDQGVMIPESNVQNLMLRQDVVDAVRDGQFHIHSVSTVDEGIALLTGAPAGERQPDGTYPDGSVNRRVQDRLRELAIKVRDYAGRPQTAPGDESQDS